MKMRRNSEARDLAIPLDQMHKGPVTDTEVTAAGSTEADGREG